MRHRVAVGLAALSDRVTATYQAAVAAALPARTLGVLTALATGALLWQSFWHGLVAWDVAVGAATAVAAVLLALPLRAVAGAFASTLSIAATAMAATYFLTAPAAVQSGAPIAEDGRQSHLPAAQTGVGDIGVGTGSLARGAPAPAAVDPRFGHVVFKVPDATRPRWEPATPCHSRLRTGSGLDEGQLRARPCERMPSGAP